ncbi:MAG: glutamyl-tRNA amidotransferase [Rhodospirillales bacterium RIFCSPLOWO2_12_FULL_58_28]|nr:MAG: glutamyl-tRNA amidotransferase [Rhodospirillales bacterium RIFCSPLOWO2_02_FULL_58_16]OHC76673.1 MAG: glutamyl-tRNA amidotransferase [Rhodospirillales bacterium RIFCSPLOWO2_12_FULL_58_28]
MLRDRLSDALKTGMKTKDVRTVATVRLILAALKDRDIAERGKGNYDGITEDAILTMLQSMIKQRRESIVMYKKGGRPGLAEQEAGEIAIIEQFLPAQIAGDEMENIIKGVIAELGANNLKDMGRIMSVLKERHAGCMDFAKAGAIVKNMLS